MILNRRLAAAAAVLCATSVLTLSGPGGAVAAGGGLTESKLAVSGLLTNDGYGHAMAMSGHTTVVAAYTKKIGGNLAQGALYVFDRPVTGWKTTTPTAVLTVGNGTADDELGYSVAMQGRTIVAGALGRKVNGHAGQGAVYVFNEPKGGWHTTSNPNAVLTVSGGAAYDELGSSVGIDGSTIVAGASGVAPGGAFFEGDAYVFTKGPSGWGATQTATIHPTGRGEFDMFGQHVAISGNTIVVTAVGRYTDTGRAYVFVKPPTGWANANETTVLAGTGVINNYFGTSVAIQGDVVAVGEDETTVSAKAKAGSVFVFTKPVGGWVSSSPSPTKILTASTPVANAELGASVAIDGSVIAAGTYQEPVGANQYQGAAYLFAKSGASWSTGVQLSRLVASDGAYSDHFGSSIALQGTTVAVGAPNKNSDVGAAYIYAEPGPTLSALKQTHKKWALGSKGTTFSFNLSQGGPVYAVFARVVHHKATRAGQLKVTGKAGPNSVHFTGKLSNGKTLKPGHFAVAFLVKNVHGASPAKVLRFTLKPKK